VAILKVRDLRVQFGGLVAVKNFSFETIPGEILSIIGPNGAGKTTLFNALTGFVKPSMGKLYLDDKDITGFLPHRITEMGMTRTFQKRSYFPTLSVLENMFLGCHLKNTVSVAEALIRKPAEKKAEKNEIFIKELLDFVGLNGRESTRASILPYGEQRLLGIAIALASQPKIIMLDEPCAGSNPVECECIVRLIKDICKSGITVLLVEHHMRVVMSISHRIIVLSSGEKLVEGTAEEIQGDPRVLEAYLGKKANNGTAV
jgi:branched-chain amino acid transport system ATP-binding protein